MKKIKLKRKSHSFDCLKGEYSQQAKNGLGLSKSLKVCTNFGTVPISFNFPITTAEQIKSKTIVMLIAFLAIPAVLTLQGTIQEHSPQSPLMTFSLFLSIVPQFLLHFSGRFLPQSL